MTVTEIKPGIVKLTAPNGVYSIREEKVYSEVICKTEDQKYYRAAEESEE